MKNIIIVLLLLLSNLVSGQNSSAKTETLPVVVSNIAFFPPARTQQNVPDCSYFSMIYYLKSYLWNRHFNRDPKLEENQFSHSFAWNQNIDPEYQMSDETCAFYFMKSQGCATIADFPLTESSTEVKPSLEVRTKALAYKSKRLFQSSFSTPYILSNEQTAERIESLKDSLAQGKCFSLDFRLFDSFMKLSDKHRVFSCYPGTSVDSIRPGHAVTVIGYNDTIKTATGRGAFEVINSNTALTSDGIFYFDYKWFYSGVSSFTYYFLEEDFESQAPKITLNLEVKALTVNEVCYKGFSFVDTTINCSVTNGPTSQFFNEKIDFEDFSTYLFNRNQIQIIKINESRVKLRNNMMYFPLNSSDGNYNLLTDLSSIKDFKSLSVIMFDPISEKFEGYDNEVINYYSREANCQINKAEINLLVSGKKIIAKIIDLPDTTIIANDFYPFTLMFYHAPTNYTWGSKVKSCTSVLKRKMIIFTLEEETAPVFINPPSTLTTVVNQTLSYTFEAKDDKNSPITYYLENTSPEASLTSNGKLTFKSAKTGTYNYTVVASNSLAATTLPVTVKVDLSDAASDIEAPETSVKVFPNPMVNNVSVEFLLTKEETVKIVIYDYLGRQIQVIANKIYYAGENNFDYDATDLLSGVYIIKFQAGFFKKSIKVVKQ